MIKLSTYDNRWGVSLTKAKKAVLEVKPTLGGTSSRKSKTMIVIAITITPSLKDSTRLVDMIIQSIYSGKCVFAGAIYDYTKRIPC